MIILKEIEIIKNVKKRKKITNLELSNLSGVPLGTLNKILAGNTSSVKVDTLVKLEQALKIKSNAFEWENKNLDNFGYVKVGAYTNVVSVANVLENVNAIKRGIDEGCSKGVKVLVFPELSLTGYTCGDLFFQETLLNSAIEGLFELVNYSIGKDTLIFVGMPLKKGNNIYNVAACFINGEILGFTPKTNLSSVNDFYEVKYFKSGEENYDEILLKGKSYPFYKNLIYACREMPNFTVSSEISEDLFANIPSSTIHALNGGYICVNLASANEIVGKAEFRRKLIETHTKNNNLAYVYANSGFGESTTDLVFAGHNIICENGKILNESKLFDNGLILSDIDVDYLSYERSKIINTSSNVNANCKKVYFSIFNLENKLDREYSKTPFIPASVKEINEKAELILNLQAHGLAKRIKHVNAKSIVIGISGGLDSTLAILVAVRAMKLLNRDLKDIYAITMPCFGTTSRTKNNAYVLCESLGVTFKEINIKESVKLHFKDIGQDENLLDVTYENSQARERTQVLMDVSNKLNGIVVGTGDLSELALGWATYNGDHMSMYGVNASIPKTLIRYIVKYEANNSPKILKETLLDILDTPVSPELIPSKGEDMSQKTEDIVGPYLLHDFYLYYAIKMGFKPSKIYHIAKLTFSDIYDNNTIYKWLNNFYNRFFNQQFKRSCMPDGVMVDDISLSPRSGFKMPSDAIKYEWLKDLEEAKDF